MIYQKIITSLVWSAFVQNMIDVTDFTNWCDSIAG